MKETYESLAAIAVFRELYNQNKDVYDILATIIKDTIISENMNIFTCAEMTDRVNKMYSFNLPESVIKTSLKRLGISRNNGNYSTPEEILKQDRVMNYQQQMKMNESLLISLYDYIETQEQIKLSSEEKEKIKEDFFDYLMNSGNESKYSMIISQYIMKVSLNPNYINTINKIREGNLIYEGICYSGNINELGTWNTYLNIFLEQEVLFYIAGYNGDVHKEIYGDLLKYISEINHGLKDGKEYIRLWYTGDVKNEIDSYFSAAERIKENGEVTDPSRKPMLYILDGAKSKGDILEKKVLFYNLLKSNKIRLHEYDYYAKENQQYNKIDENTYEALYKSNIEKEKEYIDKCCGKLNQIEILRKNKNTGFDNISYILLTANGVILKCAYSHEFYKSGEVPKATTIDFLMNRLWFKLNKGFGKGAIPKSLNIVSRAQIVLSFLANDKVSQIYEEVKEKCESEEISHEEAIALIAELRSYSKTPDEINTENAFDEITSISEFEITNRIEEMKREELSRCADKEKIENLEKKLEHLEIEYKNKEKEREEKEALQHAEWKKLLDESQKNNDNLCQQINELLNERKRNELRKERELEIQQKEEKYNKERKKANIKIGIFILCIILLIVGLIYIIKVEKSVSGVISIIVSVVLGLPVIINFLSIRKNIKELKAELASAKDELD